MSSRRRRGWSQDPARARALRGRRLFRRRQGGLIRAPILLAASAVRLQNAACALVLAAFVVRRRAGGGGRRVERVGAKAPDFPYCARAAEAIIEKAEARRIVLMRNPRVAVDLGTATAPFRLVAQSRSPRALRPAAAAGLERRTDTRPSSLYAISRLADRHGMGLAP